MGERETQPPALPLQVPVALRSFQVLQAQQRLAAGTAYTTSGYVLVNELGEVLRTDWLRWQAYEAMETAGLRHVRLYDARHAC